MWNTRGGTALAGGLFASSGAAGQEIQKLPCMPLGCDTVLGIAYRAVGIDHEGRTNDAGFLDSIFFFFLNV